MCNARTYTNQEMKIIKKFKDEHDKICAYCGKLLTTVEDSTIDHVLPIARGGKTEESNLKMCCRECNLDKADLTEEEYIEYKKELNNKLKENLMYNNLYNTYELYYGIINRSKELLPLLSKARKDINTCESKIKGSKCNVVDGYKLYKELQGLLEEEDKLNQERSENSLVLGLANNQIKALKPVMDKIANKYKTEIRQKIKDDADIMNNDKIIELSQIV